MNPFRRRLIAAALLALPVAARAGSAGEREAGLETEREAGREAELRQRVGGWLVRPDARGVLAAARWDRPPALLALYFGADYCGPCRAFLPTLAGVRNALRAAGADTEVVYVPQDDTAAAARRTMIDGAMPWPAVNVRRARSDPALRRLAGPATPNLVLIDAHGRVLASGWDGARHTGLEGVLRRWHGWAAEQAGQSAAPR